MLNIFHYLICESGKTELQHSSVAGRSSCIRYVMYYVSLGSVFLYSSHNDKQMTLW